jgi:hypothetical protein
MLIRFTPNADTELTEARRWYSHKRQDLDLEFMQCSTTCSREWLVIHTPFRLFTDI